MRHALLKLEVFETTPRDDDAPLLDVHQAEKLREAAYEQGYAAGWQDALEQMRNEDELRRIAAEEALQAISFSYHEAHGALQASFVALTSAMLETVMPEMMHQALPVCVTREIDMIVAQNTRLPVRLSCAPSACAALQPIVSACTQIDIELVEEPSFSDAQVALSIGSQDRLIDLDRVLARLRDIFASSAQKQQVQETTHG